jgi:hypothetical protein
MYTVYPYTLKYHESYLYIPEYYFNYLNTKF